MHHKRIYAKEGGARYQVWVSILLFLITSLARFSPRSRKISAKLTFYRCASARVTHRFSQARGEKRGRTVCVEMTAGKSRFACRRDRMIERKLRAGIDVDAISSRYYIDARRYREQDCTFFRSAAGEFRLSPEKLRERCLRASGAAKFFPSDLPAKRRK